MLQISATTLSFAVWSGVAAGLGAALLAGKTVANITFIAANTSFVKAGLIGGGSITVAAVTFMIGLLFLRVIDERGSDSDRKFLVNWSWIPVVPLILIPYLAGVSITTGITLVALGALGALAKHATVGLLPD